MERYKMAKGWRIFVYFTAIPMFLIFGSMLFLPFWDGSAGKEVLWFLVPMSLAMMGIIGIGLYDTIKGEAIIGKHKLYKVGFPKRELAFDEIKGYRKQGYYIFIEPHSKQQKKITLHTFIERKSEFLAWLAAHYPDLDAVAAQEERNEILDSDKFGSNIEERIVKIRKVKKNTRLLNGIAILSAAWTVFLPDPDNQCAFACIGIFIALIAFQKRHEDVLKINPKNGTSYPSIIFGLLVVSGAMLYRGIGFNMLRHSPVWLPTFGLAGLLLGVLLWKNKKLASKEAAVYFATISFAMFIIAFSYGTVISLNCMLDKSSPTIYNAQILSKRINTGTVSTRYIKLSEWGNQTECNEVYVSQKLYRSVAENDDVIIYLKAGRLGISWFEIVPIQ